MQTIHYGQSEFDTADAIARAVLEYAEALATRRRFAVIDIPTVTIDGVATAHLLIGPGIPLASAAARAGDSSPREETPRDEFGGLTGRSAMTELSDIEVHRAVRDLAEGAQRVRDRISATPLDGDSLLDDLPDLGLL